MLADSKIRGTERERTETERLAETGKNKEKKLNV